MISIDGKILSCLIPQFFAGLIAPSAYGAELAPVLDSILMPVRQQALDNAEQTCASQYTFTYGQQVAQSALFQSLWDGFAI